MVSLAKWSNLSLTTFANYRKQMIEHKLAVFSVQRMNGLSGLQTQRYTDIQQHCQYNV